MELKGGIGALSMAAVVTNIFQLRHSEELLLCANKK